MISPRFFNEYKDSYKKTVQCDVIRENIHNCCLNFERSKDKCTNSIITIPISHLILIYNLFIKAVN